MKVQLALVYLIPLLLLSCDFEKKQDTTVKTGLWRAAIEIQEQELPFGLQVTNNESSGYHAYLINANEQLLLDNVNLKGDSIDIVLHVFDANIKAKITGDSMQGLFIKNYEKDYKIPFKAVFGLPYRFKKGTNQKDTPDFSGKYEVKFLSNKDTVQAIGVFHQIEDSVTGTFLTPTGDYRYLQGNVADGKMQLSTFDGNHAYLFTATKEPDGNLNGIYYSGKTYRATWTGIKNEQATLPDQNSYTFLKPGYDRIDFSFPDVTGKKVSLNDEKYQDKVIVLQLFGTWCPNCMDETKFLAPWYLQNKARGVEIIGLAYERKDDFKYASTRVKTMAEKFDVNYDLLIAGTNDKGNASATLPMLNKIAAFPTTIFIGSDGKVKKIHTGFAGPGTGIYYDQLVEEFNETINELLKEELNKKVTSF
jgi:thiol-disulfide isomerase/thioredoxin